MVDKSGWKEYGLSDIFNVYGSKTTSKTDLEKIGCGKFPYITTQATNNGCFKCYNYWTEKGNCLTIDSAVLGTCFYQDKNFSASDHVEILEPKCNFLNRNTCLFLKVIISFTINNLYNVSEKFIQKKMHNTTGTYLNKIKYFQLA